MQEEVRDQEKSLEPWVSHIKKTFSGNERMMILSTYYRQRGYKPIYALKGSFSLLLEIPFFIAAYSFLSGLEIMNGVSFGPIANLGAPDGLITLFGISINLLPILMTIINVIAAAIYLKGFPLKSKIQMYGIAVIFLVLLYYSPAGLVFYWTLNNVFSLVKNIFYKLNNPGKVIKICLSIVGLFLLIFGIVRPFNSISRQLIILATGFVLLIPIALSLLKKRSIKKIKIFQISDATKTDTLIFIICCTFLTVLTGILIPSSVINSSTAEFISSQNTVSPIWFIVSAFLYAAGLFFIWFSIFYYLASPKIKKIICCIVFILSIAFLIDYMFFGTNYGNLSNVLVYDIEPEITNIDILFNSAIVLIVSVLCVLAMKKTKIVKGLCLVLCIAIVCMSTINIVGIANNIQEINTNENSNLKSSNPIISLSSKGKNVVILMMDKAASVFVPYLLSEKPQLKRQFEGFTYYPNTLSSGGNTLVGLPEVFGGYEYTPDKINKRTDIPLSQKHNEALKVLPAIFSNKGYNVTIGNPSFAGYTYSMDLSIFSDIKNARVYKTDKKLSTGFDNIDKKISSDIKYSQFRNFFEFSIFKSSPVIFQNQIYSSGNYNSSHTMNKAISTQVTSGLCKARGITEEYLNSYSVMVNLKTITKINNTKKNSFNIMCNDLTHSPLLLQTPDYLPELEVDNSNYDKEPLLKKADNIKQDLKITKTEQIKYYHVNMETFLLLGDWFDYLRDNHIYNNTRIILVSDHGTPTGFDQYKYGDNRYEDASTYNPILLVKDFDSKGFNTDYQFMTNADVPTLAFNNIVKHPKNPYTGQPINNAEKSKMKNMNTYMSNPQPDKNTGNTFEFTNKSTVIINKDLLNPKHWKKISIK